MTRYSLLLALVVQCVFIRTGAAQDAAPDTVADSTRSPFVLPGTWLRQLPIDDARHGLVLVPGVRLTGMDIGITSVASLSIRGSPTARGNVYVDGAPMRFQALGGAGVGLAPVVLDNVAVLTGLAPAWIGDAADGAIAYETRAAGKRWEAGLRLGGGGVFSEVTGSVGGPITRGGALTFMLTLNTQNQSGSYRGPDASGIPSYLPAGVDTLADTGSAQVAVPAWETVNDGLRRPMDWSNSGQGHLKLLYRYGNGSRASLTWVSAGLEQRVFPGQAALNPALYTGRRSQSEAVILNWQHILGAWQGGPLTADVNLSMVQHRDISGPLDSTWELDHRESSICWPFECFPRPRRMEFAGTAILDLPAGDQLVRDLRTNSGTRGVPFFGGPQAAQGARLNPYGLAMGWPTAGYGGTLSDVAERRWQGRWALAWRPTGREVTAGIELEGSRVASYASDVVRQLGTDIVTADPKRLGLFADTRLPLAGATLNLGVRYDRITPGGDMPVVPAFISSSGPAKWNPAGATDDTAYTNSVARVFETARTQPVVSPRLGLTYPISPKAEVRLGYSRAVEPLAWGTFFSRSNSDLSFTPVTDVFGRDIDFGVVGLAEMGVRFALGTTVLDVGVYRKNSPMYVGRMTPFTDPRDSSSTVNINVITLVDDTHTEGVDVGVRWQRGWVQLFGAYTLGHTTGTNAGAPPGVAPVTLHTAALGGVLQVPDDLSGGMLAAVARGMSVVVLARLQSGEPYTLLQNTGSGVIAPGPRFGSAPDESFNASSLPWFKRLDLRIAKTVRIAGHDWSAFVDARNILNLSSLTSLFAETGTTTNALHQTGNVIGDPTLGTGEYGLLRNEAANSAALQPDGTTVDLSSCATWASQANCVSLMRVEERFGNGDRSFTLGEQEIAFGSYYRDFFGGWRFYAPGRTVRLGLAFEL